LEFLEFGFFSESKNNNNKESDKKQELLLVIDPRFNDKLMLLILFKSLLLYNNYRYYWDSLNNKIKAVLLSPSKARYIITKEGIYEFLILRSLGKIELQKLQTKQVAIYKSKLNSRVSLQKDSLLLVSITLEREKTKEVIT
jgi:hypothetical protein